MAKKMWRTTTTSFLVAGLFWTQKGENPIQIRLFNTKFICKWRHFPNFMSVSGCKGTGWAIQCSEVCGMHPPFRAYSSYVFRCFLRLTPEFVFGQQISGFLFATVCYFQICFRQLWKSGSFHDGTLNKNGNWVQNDELCWSHIRKSGPNTRKSCVHIHKIP